MASNLKVDIVKPTATNGSLSLKGDSGGSATANGISVDSSGNVSITGKVTGATSLDGAVTINESGADVDFRVESNTNENALFVEGSSGRVGVCTTEAINNSQLNVNGGVNITGIIGVTVNDTFTLNGKTQPQYGCNFDGSGEKPIGISGYYGISFATSGVEKMSISAAGTTTIATADINGGNIDETTIGGTTPAAGTFSDLSTTGTESLKSGYGLFRKADPTAVLFTKTGAGTAETQTALYVEVNGSVLIVASGTSVTMPTLTAGTDYAIWVETDGTLDATTDHTSPPTAGARKIGGFHYAPGGNATGTSGGDTTSAINEYSFWDLKFRPACPDPRGMTLVAGGFWTDIYLCGVDHYTNGTSKYNVTIADSSSPPKVSAAFGGNGTTTYGSLTWFEANEIMIGHGKRLPTYTEAMTFAYGTTEVSSRGSDPGTTQMSTTDDNFTSKWGVIQSTGCLWQWLRDFIASGDGTGGFQTGLTVTRGDIYTFNASARAGIFGGAWGSGSNSGSRCSYWGYVPSISDVNLSCRGVCDHLQLD